MKEEKADTTAQKQEKKVRGVPFKKGQSGNPAGRPPGSISLLTILKQILDDVVKDPKNIDKKTYARLLVEKQLKQAIDNGNEQVQKLIWNYIEGLPKGSFDVTSLGEKIEGVVILPAKKSE